MVLAEQSVFLSSFVGRHDELEKVLALVQSKRLVTLVGAGGLGKTRLGYRAFDELRTTYGTSWSVDLAEIVDPGLLAHAVSAAMRLPGSVDEAAQESLAEAIGTERALLFLDNCEHMLDASAALVAVLLSRCPALHVLTTSRQPLAILAECVYPVPTLSRADSVQLFAERATGALATWSVAEHDSETIDRLCLLLEGVPLAIELAAVQIRTFSPGSMLDRLSRGEHVPGIAVRGEPHRRTSLEACIRWSHDLCTEQERRLWHRASVFAGSISFDALVTVCAGPGLDGDEVLSALAGLVDKSVLTREGEGAETRYRMLEVIRQFGSSRLSDANEAELWRSRHSDYYLELVERFDGDWCGPRQLEWIERFRREHANLGVAFDFAVGDPGRAPRAMRMCSVLEHYFASTGGGGVAVHWLQAALRHESGTPVERAGALRVGVFVAVLLAQLDTARAMYDELCRIADDHEESRIRAYALYAGALLRTWEGDPAAGARLAAQGVDVLHELGDVAKEANLHFLHGMMLGWADRADEAAQAYRRCLELTQPRGERWLSSYSLWGLGVDALIAGHVEEAVHLEREALADKVMFGDQLGVGLSIEVLAWAAAERNQAAAAAVLLGAASAIWDTIGMSVAAMPYLSRRREVGIAATRAQLPPAGYDQLHERGRTQPLSESVDLALGRAGVRVSGASARLTPRELEIAELVAAGATNRAIADALVISIRTVETHVENILRKLGAPSRRHVAAALADASGG